MTGSERDHRPSVRDFLAIGRLLSQELEGVILAVERDAGLTCPSLQALRAKWDATLSMTQTSLVDVGGHDDTLVLLESAVGIFEAIKEKALQKLGEACCESQHTEECRAATAHLLQVVKQLKPVLQTTLLHVEATRHE
jgi:hypothetical protein